MKIRFLSALTAGGRLIGGDFTYDNPEIVAQAYADYVNKQPIEARRN